jgi:4-amino-4-deoxy-L-arabinose transferase-like glycosyltransferase
MNLTAAHPAAAYRASTAGRDLALVLFFALLARLVTYNGAFGSDDLTYFARAAELARGEWTSANYNGALRYGFNLPAAGFMALFGPSLFVANLWPLACSLIEIGAVYAFTNSAMNPRAAVFAALLLAAAPLHMAVATRIHADPVVAMFVTVSFVLLYFGALVRRPGLLFAAGLSIGGIFWAKELAAVTWFAYLPMLLFFRGQWRNIIYVAAGTAAMLLLHGLLMTAIAGDPLHLVKVVLGALQRNFIDGGHGEDGAAYYLRYLFVDLRHSGALAFFAIASVALVPRWLRQAGRPISGFVFAGMWCLGLLAVLSVFPVSLWPLRFTMKQSNYITLFIAPIALLAGMAIATLPRTLGRLALAMCLALGLMLGALQQADYRAFAANSKALAAFALEHPRAVIIGSVNNSAMGSLWGRLQYPDVPKAEILSFREVEAAAAQSQQRLRDADEIFAVFDRQNIHWFAGTAPVTAALPCWRHVHKLVPSGLGLGNQFAEVSSRMFAPVRPLAEALDRLALPAPADIYRVDGADVMCRS